MFIVQSQSLRSVSGGFAIHETLTMIHSFITQNNRCNFPPLSLLYYRKGVFIAPKYIWMMMNDALVLLVFFRKWKINNKIPQSCDWGIYTSYCVSQHEWMESLYHDYCEI